MRIRLPLLVLLIGGVIVANAPVATAAPTSVTHDPVQAAAGWLTTQFVGATKLPTPTGDHVNYDPYQGTYTPNYGVNADAIFGFASAGVGGQKIATLSDYLATTLPDYADLAAKFGGPYDGPIGKVALAAIVAGQDPTHFGGRDLLTLLKAHECTAATASCPAAGAAAGLKPYGSSVSESFVVLAEARSGSQPSANAIGYFLSLQCTDGSFTVSAQACGAASGDVDATSYAIDALSALGGHTRELDRARSWLAGQRTVAGYWVSQGGPNVNSTGLAVNALSGSSKNVPASRSWLLAQQVPAGVSGAGALRFAGAFTPTSVKTTSPSVSATAQALPALTGAASLATLAAHASAGQSLFAPTAAVRARSVALGARQVVTAHGFAAGERVGITLHSAAVTVGTSVVAPDGSVSASFAVPMSLGTGQHTVELTGSSSGLSADSHFTVVTPVPAAAAGTAAPISAPSADPTIATAATADPTLAATGTNGRTQVRLAVLGVVVLVLGCGLTVIGRRRTG